MKLKQAPRDDTGLRRRRMRRSALLPACIGALVVSTVAWTLAGPLIGLAAGLGTAVMILGVAGVQMLQVDEVDVLTVYLFALMLIPGRYVVPGMGGIGAVANVIGLLCGVWWVLGNLHGGFERAKPGQRANPVTIALLVYLAVSSLAFVSAFSRPLAELESKGAIQSMVQLLSLVSVALLVLSGVRDRCAFNTLMRRLLLLSVAFALIAVMQFFTNFNPVTRIRIPLLELDDTLGLTSQRSDLPRVASTAMHAIEFGTVLAMLIPLALHFAFHSPPDRRRRNWLITGTLAFALPLSISRSSVLALGVAFLMMLTAWSWQRRFRVALGTVAFIVFMRLVKPGLIGTLIALFTWANKDPSTQGRTNDYARVWEFVAERPWLGRGLGTFSPIQYFFLDNQVLMTLLTAGVIGLLALLALLVTSTTSARQVYWHGHDEESRHLGATLAASIIGGVVTMFTFDALGFPIFAGLFFFLCAMSGALWQIEVAPRGRIYTNPRARIRAR